AGADDRLDSGVACQAPRQGQAANGAQRVAIADEGNELDVLPRQQRAALRGVEGEPAIGPACAGEPPTQMVQLLEVAPGGGDQQGGQAADLRLEEEVAVARGCPPPAIGAARSSPARRSASRTAKAISISVE